MIIFILTLTLFWGVDKVNGEMPTAKLLKWNFKKAISINLIKQGEIEVYQHGKLKDKSIENNIINFVAQTINETDEETSFEAIFKVFSTRKNGLLTLENEFKSKFKIKPNGEYLVPHDQIQPSIRSIPSFPKYKVKPGDKWIARCSYLYYQFDPAFLLITNAYYTYLSNIEGGKGERSKTNYAVIKIEYQFFRKC